MDKKIKYLRIDFDLHAGLKTMSEKSGIKIERLTAEAVKSFLAKNEHLKSK